MIIRISFFISVLALGVGNCLATSYEDGATIIDADTYIQPTTFKGRYPKDADEKWLLVQEQGAWALIFRQMSIEKSRNCKYDFIEIREPWNGTEIVPPTRYCGDHTPLPYISQSPVVHIRFRSDRLWEQSGFWLQVIHAPNRDLLEQKIESYSSHRLRDKGYSYHGNKDLTEHADLVPSTKTHSRGPVFYLLIGSCSSGLIIFCLMLVYYLVTVSKRRKRSSIPQTKSSRKPDRSSPRGQHYVNQAIEVEIGEETNPKRTSAASCNDSCDKNNLSDLKLHKNSGKPNKAGKECRSTCSTMPKTVSPSPTERTYHNNVYVLQNSQN